MQKGQIIYLEGGATSSYDIKGELDNLNCLIHITDHIREAINIISRTTVDLIILDSFKIDGNLSLEFIDTLKTSNIPLVFISLDEDVAVFDKLKATNLVAYLVEPFSMLTFQSIISPYLNLESKNIQDVTSDGDQREIFQGALFIKVNQIFQKVSIDNITHVQSEGNYCFIYTHEKKYAIKLSMIRLNQMLASKGFLQVHKSYLAQLSKIDNIDISNNEVLIDHLKIPLGRKYKQNLLAHLNLL